jgi:endonuclease-3
MRDFHASRFIPELRFLLMDLKERALAIHQTLLDFYGYPEWRNRLPPLDELVATILSQNTSDTNSGRAFEALRARFPTWEAVRDAEPQEVIETIRSAGLANQKGPRIQAVLRDITAEVGSLTRFLHDLSPKKLRLAKRDFKGQP